jgi:putative ABC transport system ATP-binding protein
MSFIFQQFHLIPNLTVLENIELTLDINKIDARFSVDDILKKIGLLDKKNNYPFELSGGEQQRVAIARAFI